MHIILNKEVFFFWSKLFFLSFFVILNVFEPVLLTVIEFPECDDCATAKSTSPTGPEGNTKAKGYYHLADLFVYRIFRSNLAPAIYCK